MFTCSSMRKVLVNSSNYIEYFYLHRYIYNLQSLFQAINLPLIFGSDLAPLIYR